MFWQKACPKCFGNLFFEDIEGNWYVVCLQCGYRSYVSAEDAEDTATLAMSYLHPESANAGTMVKEPQQIRTPHKRREN
jgi:uncharacterized Zn finger protein (UPF0148 family)